MTMTQSSLVGLSVALGCGLLIGIERERRKGSGPTRAYAGVRSFALAAMLGALAQTQNDALVVIAALLIVALSAISHYRDRSNDPGITTELALFLSFLLGVNAIADPALSAAAAVIIAAMLNLRMPLHHFARVSLRTSELRDALILAGAALVVYPLLPDAASGWLLGANPRRLWGLVILIMSLQAAAHVALRAGGSKVGLALSGFASGFVSSTATTAAMGMRCRRDCALMKACVSGALLSNIATFLLLAIVTMTIAPGLLMPDTQIAASLGCGLLAACAVSGISLLGQRGAAVTQVAAAGRAFSIQQALAFALMLSAATGAVAYANAYLGQAAARLGAAIAGLADVHAAAGSVWSLANSGALSPSQALLAMLLALSTNSVSKLVAAALGGGAAFAARVGLGLALILLAAWAPYWWSLSR
jgi:uncharacterized membrane protein (DUF4010 family)